METTRIGLGGIYPSSAKLYAPIFTSKNTPLNVSMSISAQGEHVKNTSITIVYWEDGQKKIIKDFLAGGASTPIDFTIQNPSAIPPFIMYLETSGLYGVIDINVLYDTPLTVGEITPYDERLLLPEDSALPLLDLQQVYISDTKPFAKLKQLYSTAETTRSPLIVDLDGDGVETTNIANGVYFDHDGNGFAEKSAWVGKDDGLLVRDINGNGQIDNGTELFGNNSVLSNGQKATNGFEALVA